MLPRERMRSKGAGSLSDPELLALILGTGFRTSNLKLNATEISEGLIRELGDLGSVINAPAEILEKYKGVGVVKASRLSALLEIAKRIRVCTASSIVTCAEDAYALFSDLESLEREELWVALLDQKGRCLKKLQVCVGGRNSCSVNPREIVRLGVKYDGIKLLIAHNHPSGDARPSEDDVNFTQGVWRAAETVGVDFLDHIIVGRDHKFFSFAREGFMPSSKKMLIENYADFNSAFSREKTVVPITR